MSTAALLDRLEGVRRTSSHTWRARCPSHKSTSLTLSVKEDGERTPIFSFAGCSCEEVVAAVGLEVKDLWVSADTGERARETLPWRDIFAGLEEEVTIVCVAASNIANGVALSDADRARLLTAYQRITAARRLGLGR